MENLDFNFCKVEEGEYVTSENEGESILIKDNLENVWMKISSTGKSVVLKLFPKNIPQNVIGSEAQANEELTYYILCETEEDAFECKSFLSDFIVIGYGKPDTKRTWLCALDLEDITHIFSSRVTHYYKISYDAMKTSVNTLDYYKERGLKAIKTLFVCTHNVDLDEADKIAREFAKELSDDGMIWNQFIIDESEERDNSVRVFYNEEG